MKSRHAVPRLLRPEHISPRLNLADCWRYGGDNPFRYRNPAHHLILVESGCIRGKPSGGAEFDARAGDLICFRPANVNEYLVREPTVFYQAGVRFAPPPRHEWTPLLGEHGPWPVRVSLGQRFTAARRVFETLCMEVVRADAVNQFRIRTAVWELLTIVTETVAEQPSARPHLDDWDRLRARLSGNLREEMPVAKLAAEMGLNPSHFIRQFKRRFGLSPKAYLTRVRLHEAVRLLRSTNMPVKSVAFELGFPSLQSFERLFKHHIGLRPLESRSHSLFDPAKAAAPSLHPFQMNRFNLAPHIAALGPDWWKIISTPRPERRVGRRR